MSYLKFTDSDSVIECTVKRSASNVVTLIFPETITVDTSGFNVYKDAAGEYNVGGDAYLEYTTIYRNDDTTAAYGGYQLSNDGSAYVEPEEEEIIDDVDEESTVTELTEEEQAIADLQSQIDNMKSSLASTDYIIIKAYEASLVGESLDEEYDFATVHAERQEIRDSINEAETQLAELVSASEDNTDDDTSEDSTEEE